MNTEELQIEIDQLKSDILELHSQNAILIHRMDVANRDFTLVLTYLISKVPKGKEDIDDIIIQAIKSILEDAAEINKPINLSFLDKL